MGLIEIHLIKKLVKIRILNLTKKLHKNPKRQLGENMDESMSCGWLKVHDSNVSGRIQQGYITLTWTVIFEYFLKFLLIIYSSHDCGLSYIIKNYLAWIFKRKVSKMCLPQNTDSGMVGGDSKIFLLPNDFIQPYFQKLLIRANSQSLKFQVWSPSYDAPLWLFVGIRC